MWNSYHMQRLFMTKSVGDLSVLEARECKKKTLSINKHEVHYQTIIYTRYLLF